MATVPKFQINGVLNTDNNVLQNLNDMCNSCGSWLTFDPNTGLWSVVINKPETSKKSFNDSNIIGSVSISGTGINEFYNSVSVEFPHKDLRDQTDYVDYEIPQDQRFPNEQDNSLQMSLKYINDPVQAAYIAQVELKQARVDKVIEFATDYSAMGLRAGDVIDVTSEVYGYVNKKFRITKLQEADDDNGSIVLKITALEYDEGVYDDTGLIRTERTKKTGIVPKSMNTALTESDINAAGQTATQQLTIGLDTASQEQLQALVDQLVKRANLQALVTSGTTPAIPAAAAGTTVWHTISQVVLPYTGMYKFRAFMNWGGSITAGDMNERHECLKVSQLNVLINGSQTQVKGPIYTGDNFAQLLEDHQLEGFFMGAKGQTASLQLAISSNWSLGNGAYIVPVYDLFYVPPVFAETLP